MAKKKAAAKKKSSKPAKKRAAARPAPKRKAPRPSAGPAAAPAGGPVAPINTGSGPSPAEVGSSLVTMFNQGTPDEKIWDALFAKDFTSIEGHGANMMFRGRHAVEGKAREWTKTHVVHGAKAEGPFLGATGFAVKFTIDVEDTSSGKRQTMNEIAVYTMQNGKVIQEEFMYGG